MRYDFIIDQECNRRFVIAGCKNIGNRRDVEGYIPEAQALDAILRSVQKS